MYGKVSAHTGATWPEYQVFGITENETYLDPHLGIARDRERDADQCCQSGHAPSVGEHVGGFENIYDIIRLNDLPKAYSPHSGPAKVDVAVRRDIISVAEAFALLNPDYGITSKYWSAPEKLVMNFSKSLVGLLRHTAALKDHRYGRNGERGWNIGQDSSGWMRITSLLQ